MLLEGALTGLDPLLLQCAKSNLQGRHRSPAATPPESWSPSTHDSRVRSCPHHQGEVLLYCPKSTKGGEGIGE